MYKSLPEHSPYLTQKKRGKYVGKKKEMVSNKSVQRTVACGVVLKKRGRGNFQLRLSPRWNALVDWHSMLRLKGLMYCRWRTEKGCVCREGGESGSESGGSSCPGQPLQRCTCIHPATIHIATAKALRSPHFFCPGRHKKLGNFRCQISGNF